MSLKQILFSCGLLIFVFNCKNRKKVDYSVFTEIQKDSLATRYHQISDFFLQPSELYRIYKDSALMVQPNNVDLRQRLSYSYKKVGEHIKAMEVLNRAVDIDTSNGKADALQYRAWTLLYYYRDYEGVIRDVNMIEKLTGNSYNSCWGEPCGFHKGQALYKLERFEEAIEVFESTNMEEKKLGFDYNDNYMIFFYIGRCHSEMAKYDKAIEYYKKSLASVNKFPEAYYQIGLVYKKINKLALANKNFNLAKQYINYSMNEPYIERFDEVFLYMVEKELNH